MAKLDFTGMVLKVGEVQEISAKFSKRSVVVEEDGGNPDYPNQVEFECHKDDTSMLDGITAGDSVTVTAFVNGRYWEKGDRYFTTLKMAGIVSHSSEATAAESNIPGGDDDVPF